MWKDPGQAVRNARDAARVRRRAVASSCPTCPDRTAAKRARSTDDELDQLAMPTFDGIGHAAAWFERVRRSCPDHAEILCDLGDEF